MQLRIKHADGHEENVALDKAKPLKIGADSSADVVISGRGVLPVHVGIAFRDGSFVAMASKAAQTIDVNGQPVNQAPLEEGDRLKIGPVTITASAASAAGSDFDDEFGLAPEEGSHAPAKSAPAKPKAPPTPAPTPIDDEFGLAPMDDVGHGKPAKPAPAAAPKPAAKSPPAKSAPVKPSAPVEDDEFGLTPMDDEGHGKTPAKPAGKPAPSKPAAPVSKKPDPLLDDEDDGAEIGLSPMEDSGHGKKPAKTPAKPTAATPAAKSPAGKAPATKAPAGKAPAGKPADPKKVKPPADDDFGLSAVDPLGDGGLEPLGDDSGLEPLGDDGLEPLGDEGSSFDDALGSAAQAPSKPAGKDAKPTAKDAKPAAKDAKAVPARPRKGKTGPSFGQKLGKALQSPAARKAGIGLAALAAVLLVTFILLKLPTADASFQSANQQFQNKEYAQAAESFQKFLTSYPGDPRVGEARAKKGLSQLLLTLDASSDWPASLRAAEESLSSLGPDARNEAARATLAAALPKIAQNLSERASTAFTRKHETAPAMFEEAQRALALVAKHVSPADRREQGMPAVEVKMFRLEKDLQLAQSLSKAVAEIKAAAEAKQLAQAYELRTKLLVSYPRLASHSDLDAAMRLVADAATAAVEHKLLDKKALGADPTGPIALSLSLAARVGGSLTVPAGALPAVVAAPSEGTVYGVDLAKGTVVWRRFLGFNPQVEPVVLGESKDARVLLVDSTAGGLVMLEQATGKLVWRQAIEGIVAAPAIGKSQAYVPTARGAVYTVDLKSGALQAETVLPQPISAPPALEESTGRVYQLGDHSNLYVLSSEGKCEAAFSTGHEPGTVHLAPLLMGNYLLLAVDEEVDSTTLRVFQKGRDFKPLQSLKLAGHLSRAPLAVDKTLYLATDDGNVLRCDVDPAKGDQPLVALSPLVGLPAGPPVNLALVGRELWVAGAGLSIYTLPLVGEGTPRRFFTGDRLVDVPRPLGSGKNSPWVLVRRPRGWPGLAVSLATSAEDLATKPAEVRLASLAGPAGLSAKGEQMALVHPVGGVEEITSGVFTAGESPVLASLAAESARRPLEGTLLAWDDTHSVFLPGPGSDAILVFTPGDAKSLRRISLPGPVASTPIRAGDLLLVAIQRGPLFLVDPTKGPVGEPFWAKLSAGQFPDWRGPTETAPGQFVISDGHEKIYRIAVNQAKLEVAAEAALESPLTSPLAAVGNLVWGADARGQLLAFGTDLKPAGAIPLDSPVAWGPISLGEWVLVATAGERLIAVGSEPTTKWQIDLPHGAIAGATKAGAENVLFASQSGTVWGLKLDTGELLSAIELGLPLAGQPVVASDKVVVTGRDGAVHVLSATAASLFKSKPAENAAASAAP